MNIIRLIVERDEAEVCEYSGAVAVLRITPLSQLLLFRAPSAARPRVRR